MCGREEGREGEMLKGRRSKKKGRREQRHYWGVANRGEEGKSDSRGRKKGETRVLEKKLIKKDSK